MEKRSFVEWLNYKPTKLDTKIKAFEYFVRALVRQTNNYEEFKNNDFSQLKVQKLLFLACSANTELLGIFDNWVAMPYGPIEYDIYKYTRENKGVFSFFKMSSTKLELVCG